MHDLTKEARKSDVNTRLTSDGVVPYAMTEALLREEDISLYNVISNIVSREWRPPRGVRGLVLNMQLCTRGNMKKQREQTSWKSERSPYVQSINVQVLQDQVLE